MAVCVSVQYYAAYICDLLTEGVSQTSRFCNIYYYFFTDSILVGFRIILQYKYINSHFFVKASRTNHSHVTSLKCIDPVHQTLGDANYKLH